MPQWQSFHTFHTYVNSSVIWPLQVPHVGLAPQCENHRSKELTCFIALKWSYMVTRRLISKKLWDLSAKHSYSHKEVSSDDVNNAIKSDINAAVVTGARLLSQTQPDRTEGRYFLFQGKWLSTYSMCVCVCFRVLSVPTVFLSSAAPEAVD